MILTHKNSRVHKSIPNHSNPPCFYVVLLKDWKLLPNSDSPSRSLFFNSGSDVHHQKRRKQREGLALVLVSRGGVDEILWQRWHGWPTSTVYCHTQTHTHTGTLGWSTNARLVQQSVRGGQRRTAALMSGEDVMIVNLFWLFKCSCVTFLFPAYHPRTILTLLDFPW